MGGYYRKPKFFTLTIPSGGQETEFFRVGDYLITAVKTPAAFTGIAITLRGCEIPNGTYLPVHDSAGTEISLVVAPDRITGVDGNKADAAAGIPFMKLRSGAVEAAARTVIVMLK